MLCPYCNTDKPLLVPVCHVCQSRVTMIEHVIYSSALIWRLIRYWFHLRLQRLKVDRKPTGQGEPTTELVRNAMAELMRDFWLLDKQQMAEVRNLALFYPGSGYDLTIPIEIFAPYITDFWFVDDGYFVAGNPRTRRHGYNLPADQQTPVLVNDHDFEFVQKTVRNYPDWQASHADIAPCTLTEIYTHKTTQREIRIHRHRGCALTLLHHEPALQRLGVFFYRGNHKPETGTATPWLAEDTLNEVLNRLVHGGLLVLDGTDGPDTSTQTGIYSELCHYVNNPLAPDEGYPEQMIKSRKAFSDARQRVFQCVGFAGMQDYPSLIWQVHSGEGAPTQMLDGQNHAKEAWEIEAEDREKERREVDRNKYLEAKKIAPYLWGQKAIYCSKGRVAIVKVTKMTVDEDGFEIKAKGIRSSGMRYLPKLDFSGAWSISSINSFCIWVGYGCGELYIRRDFVDDIVVIAKTRPPEEHPYFYLIDRVRCWSADGFNSEGWEALTASRHENNLNPRQ